jgi:hypothetical protein
MTLLNRTAVEGIPRSDGPSFCVEARRDFIHPGDPAQTCRIVRGWVGAVTVLSDGRRQVVDLFLPGEILSPRSPQGVWNVGLTALTPLRLAPMTDPGGQTEQRLSYLYQTNAILRLGCLTAYERLGHLFLELHERMAGASRTARRPSISR